MKSEIMRKALIGSAIRTISEVGIDHATTKLLATNAGLNEVYIYRIFGGKDELFKEAFISIDKSFSDALLSFLPIVYDKSIDIRVRFRKLFEKVWQYALDDKEQCSFFIRYYYSRCYTNAMTEDRKRIYFKIIKIFETAFSHGADAWWLFNHILDVIFSSAVKILREEIPDNKQTEEKIFDLIYSAIQPHLK